MMTTPAPSVPAPPVASPSIASRLGAAWRGWPGRVARLGIALLPLMWLSRRVTVSDVADRIARIGWGGLSMSLACAFGAYWLGAWRWAVLLRAYGARSLPSLVTLFRFHLIGGWFALLPSGLAGDAVRGFRVREHVPDLAASYTAIAVERICGFVGLLIIAVSAALLGGAGRQDQVLRTLEVFVGLGLVLGTGALLGPYLVATRPRLRGLLARIPVAGGVIVRIPPAKSIAGPAFAVLLSIVIQGLAVGMVGALAHPLAPSVSALAFAAVVPFILLFTFFPVTPGGFGQREVVCTYFLGLVGVAAGESVATALLTFVTLSVPAVAGGVLYLTERAMEARTAG